MAANAEEKHLSTYRLRILLVGLTILVLSFGAGIFLSFYKWDRGSPFDRSSWNAYNPLGRATYGTLVLSLLMFPITIPVLFMASLLIYFGIKRQRRWPLVLFGFMSMGAYWLFLVVGVLNFD